MLTLLGDEEKQQGADKPIDNEKHAAYMAKVEENKEARRILEYVAKAVWNKESETGTNMAYTPFEETEFYDPEVTFDLFTALVNNWSDRCSISRIHEEPAKPEDFRRHHESSQVARSKGEI